MVIHCHVHVCAFTPPHGKTSAHLLSTLPFRFMRWQLGLRGEDGQTERDLETTLVSLIRDTPEVDAVVALAFDAVYNDDGSVGDPMLLEPALKRGVTVIGAHCGTKSAPGETDFLPQWERLAREYEHFYGDTAALNLPTRCYAYTRLLEDDLLRSKLIHGS